jgi:rod shape determining protein RodA
MKLTEPLLVKPVKEESFFKRVIYKTNWELILASLGLVAISFLMIYSATLNTGKPGIFISKQFFALVFGLVLMIIFSLVNYQIYQVYYKYFYVVSVILLILVLIFGVSVRGTRAWIDFKFFNLQPTEIIKIFFIIFLSGLFDQNWETNNSFKKISLALISYFIITILVLLQPDLSNAVLYFPIVLSIFYLAGVDRTFLGTLTSYFLLTSILFLTKIYFSLSNISLFPKWVNTLYNSMSGSVKEFAIIIFIIFTIILFIWWVIKNLKFNLPNIYLYLTLLVIILSFISVIFATKFVKMYQQKRIIAFIKPTASPSDAGYQVIQTRIAIGSGRLFGKGLFKGTQTQLGFVPEKHTDFIFSLIAEELGFVGASIVILLYAIIIFQGINIMLTSRDSFGSLLACGITSLFSFYFLINIGMCLGILPVIGLPLPFVSYGGSNLVSSFIAIGLLNSVHLRKFIY